MEEFLISYVKAGLIGWGVWFVLSVLYILISFGLDISLYRDLSDDNGNQKTGWSLRGIFVLILWPWGMISKAKQVVMEVETRLKRKENKTNGFQG